MTCRVNELSHLLDELLSRWVTRFFVELAGPAHRVNGSEHVTAEEAQQMLLEDERRLKSKSGVSAFVTRGHCHRGREAGGSQHCGKAGHK